MSENTPPPATEQLQGTDNAPRLSVIGQVALELASIGLRVFPAYITKDGQKAGIIGKRSPLYNGNRWSSTADAAVIRDYWSASPRAMIGVPTGLPLPCGNLLVVIDLDVPAGHKDKADGVASFTQYAKPHGGVPLTVTAITGSGGYHLWFKVPPDCHVVNGTEILPGVDVRGDGGMVIAPPSYHKRLKGPYRWGKGRRPDQLPIAPMPPWLLDLLKTKAQKSAGKRKTTGGVISELEQVLLQPEPEVLPIQEGWEAELLSHAGAGLETATRYDATAYVTAAEAAALLNLVNADLNHDDWFRVGMALHLITGGAPLGLELWESWSAEGNKYKKADEEKNKPSECAYRYDTFSTQKAETVGFGTLLRVVNEQALDRMAAYELLAEIGVVPDISKAAQQEAMRRAATVRTAEAAMDAIAAKLQECGTMA